MNATYFNKSIDQLKTSIIEQLQHNTLFKYIDEPMLIDNQLFYLLLPLLNGENWNDDLTISAITVAMVHASLAEHEKIDEYLATSKEQQLTVLSGDFYSGRYYQMLAKAGNILLIREISKGIVNRCEQQIKIYEMNPLSLTQWIDYISTIETELIHKFYSFYEFGKYNRIMSKGLVLLRLKEELIHYKTGRITNFIKMVQSNLDSSESFEQVIGQEVDKLNDQVNEYLQSSSLLKDDLKLYIMNQLELVQK
ncbi:Heptaprenyl diphosphate synthase OS=Ureibacillus acetophenoni OX=614649 GN=SAMN05877842_103332 PE=4 SV=1 [Ureibacillus acetophenoni]